MKLFLDDERIAPDGWKQLRWPEEIIEILKSKAGHVTHISLDHDLGDNEAAKKESRKERTGYDVLLWLERQVYAQPSFPVPVLVVHSANSVAAGKMKLAIKSIELAKLRY